ncbi:hypothetical protein [Kozakia baliensis]|uniref:hypothetical protein n=1 Tax=Kozakia baliensis TaxID=153496 RepID=UPI0004963A24|nr:hypothetical protein [Kozakia baliensis]AOX20005.1 hypothetical protein A0U90_06555 [Kozakia baliensis]
MTGITPIEASLLASASTDNGLSLQNASPAIGNEQLAFAESTSVHQTMRTEQVFSGDTLGDRILAGLGKIGGTFGQLDNLAPHLLSGDSLAMNGTDKALSPDQIGDMQNAHGVSGDTNSVHNDHNGQPESIIDKIKREGIDMYNQSLTREIAFTNAEFESHIITVSSQNMSSTLKSLLTQGG